MENNVYFCIFIVIQYLLIVMQEGLILVPGNRRLFTVIEEDDFQYPHTKVRHRFYMYLLEDGDF